MIAEKNRDINEAVMRLEVLSKDEKARLLYESLEKKRRDEIAREEFVKDFGIEIGEKRGIEIGEKRGIEIGEKRGIEIGEKQGSGETKLEIVTNLIKETEFDDVKISKLANCEVELVAERRKQIHQLT